MNTCNNTACMYNENGTCTMYSEDRTDELRTEEFYKKWNPKRAAKPKFVARREGDMF